MLLRIGFVAGFTLVDHEQPIGFTKFLPKMYIPIADGLRLKLLQCLNPANVCEQSFTEEDMAGGRRLSSTNLHASYNLASVPELKSSPEVIFLFNIHECYMSLARASIK